ELRVLRLPRDGRRRARAARPPRAGLAHGRTWSRERRALPPVPPGRAPVRGRPARGARAAHPPGDDPPPGRGRPAARPVRAPRLTCARALRPARTPPRGPRRTPARGAPARPRRAAPPPP